MFVISQHHSHNEDRPYQSIVLDLDETLVHTFSTDEPVSSKYKSMKGIKERLYEIKAGDEIYYGIKRPHLSEFIDYCFKRFDAVAVWSAGTSDYVDEIVKVINPKYDFTCVMNRSHCDKTHNEIINKKGHISHDKADYSKPLNLLFEQYPQHFSRYSTFVLDDREDYAHKNLLNWLEIPAYEPEIDKLEDDKDDYLLKLMEWLDRPEVINSQNVMILSKDWY